MRQLQESTLAQIKTNEMIMIALNQVNFYSETKILVLVKSRV